MKKNLVKQQIITKDSCELYHDHQEDVRHAIYLCPKLDELWYKVPIGNHSSLKQVSTFVDLLRCIFAKNKDSTLFSTVIWVLWNRQNNLRLGNVIGMLDQLLSQARDRLREFALHNTSTIAPIWRQPTSWQPPENSQCKINFNSTLFQLENCARIGMIIRNEFVRLWKHDGLLNQLWKQVLTGLSWKVTHRSLSQHLRMTLDDAVNITNKLHDSNTQKM